MSNSEITPEKIKTPIQLLAVWFVALIVLDGSFLTAANVILSPGWLSTALVIAAIINVPLFLCCMFLLQTRFRPEMQSDEHYSEYLNRKVKANTLAVKLSDYMNEIGFSFEDFVQGRSISKLKVNNIRPLIEELSDSIDYLQNERQFISGADPESMKILAQGELAFGNWGKAARILVEYSQHCPDDFEASFSRGVAYANMRGGLKTNLAALRALNDAITFIPETIDENYKARLFTYRGAMLKRLHRYEEALADFTISERLATNDYEVSDLMYNQASTYAMKGDRESMLAIIRKIPPQSYVLNQIKARLGTYFSKFESDKEFLLLLNQ